VLVPYINHADVEAFAGDRVNLPSDKAQEHRDQVNRLRDRLKTKIAEDPDYGLVKSLHAGSVAKRTALKSVNDLDLAVYVKAADAPTDTDSHLVSWLAERLFEATTNMDRSQFEEQAHCVTVNYRGSGLNVDVVPVLYRGEPNDVGYLINKNTGDRLLTSISRHLTFVRTRRDVHGQQFLEVIRLAKWWKRQVAARRGEIKFKSFMIELIWAHLVDNGTPVTDYTKALEVFFGWICRTELEDQIWFDDFCGSASHPQRGNDPIEILDPVNDLNNVACRYTQRDRITIVDEAQNALDALTEARFATTKGRAGRLLANRPGPHLQAVEENRWLAHTRRAPHSRERTPRTWLPR
jgi:tRNA nucleotidyltransferase (CCA-adding enzyme)